MNKLLIYSIILFTVSPIKSNKTIGKSDYKNLIVPQELREQALKAIQYYPELKNIQINVDFKDTKTTMETRPLPLTMLLQKRKYVIFVDNDVKNNYGILVKDVPFEAQIGLFGHEFAHILDYETRSNIAILKIGKKYISHQDISEYEKHIDSLTIKRGLGYYLKKWSNYVLNESNASEDYKNYKRKNYLTPQEIENIMSK